MKSKNESPAPEPIRILGGSPMSVAVPPTLEAMTIGSRIAAGRIAVAAAIRMAIGYTKITVVTLSQTADNRPVNHTTMARTLPGRPRVRSMRRATAQSNTPVVLSTPTTAIIDASRSSTLRSSAWWAPSNVIRCQGVK